MKLFKKKINEYTKSKKKMVKYLIKNKYYLYKYKLFFENKYLKKERVIYTCSTGGYDRPLIHGYFDNKWEYIFYTDDPKLIKKKKLGMWNIKKIEKISEIEKLDNHYINRWYKLFPEKILKNYKISLYIDANIRIMSKEFYNDLEKKIKDNVYFSSGRHPKRFCLYEESKVCIKAKLDNELKIKNQMKKYKKEGFPIGYGLYEANILLRFHEKKDILNLMNCWWKEITLNSKRDQLSLTYCMWKNNIKMQYLSDIPYRKQERKVKILSHSKKRKLVDN